MTFISGLLHLLTFALPAILVGAIVALAIPAVLRLKSDRIAGRWMRHTLINCLCGLAALAGGLWFFGVDGKLMTYTAMLACIGTSQALQSRIWRQ